MQYTIHRCLRHDAYTRRLPLMVPFVVAAFLLLWLSSAMAGSALTNYGDNASNDGVYPTTSPTPVNPSFPIAPRIPIEDLMKSGQTRPSTSTLNEKDLLESPSSTAHSPYMASSPKKATPTPAQGTSKQTFAPATSHPGATGKTQTSPSSTATSTPTPTTDSNFSRKTVFEYMLGKKNEQGLDTASTTPTPTPESAEDKTATSSSTPVAPTSTSTTTSLPDAVGTQYSLDFNGLAIGTPLPQYGIDLAVVPADNTTLAMGLNGINQSVAVFDGHSLAHFRMSATVFYNFPDSADEETETLITFDLTEGVTRQLRAKLTTSPDDGKTWALFALKGGTYAPDMLCGPQKILWKEGKPKTIVLEKQQGALRYFVDDQLVCGSPVSDSAVMRDFTIHLSTGALVYSVELDALPKTPTQTTAEPTRKPVEQHGDNTFYRISMAGKNPGDPYTMYGSNLIVLRDDQGKYLGSASKDGSNIAFPVTTTDAFGVDILTRNMFPLSDRVGWTDRFDLFTLIYKNGIKESYSLNVMEDENYQLMGRYFISRSGPNYTGYTSSTDWLPWVNAVDFNEFKVLKANGVIRLFYNGQFIRNEPTRGDSLIRVHIPLRYGDRLYDIIVASNLSVAEEKERSQ
ncbi:hypothetical protein [Desulfovibrio inopinatus]|uniref:hypothetical protein n=1 Tax=Desulfovibrio inopinatus TaxID=102109 RepID=UPI000484285B|nr:hypothetical protein [Desulfovibrio inopinatus]